MKELLYGAPEAPKTALPMGGFGAAHDGSHRNSLAQNREQDVLPPPQPRRKINKNVCRHFGDNADNVACIQ